MEEEMLKKHHESDHLRYNKYELMLWWKLVAKAHNIPWIQTQCEIDLFSSNQGSRTVKYLEEKFGPISIGDDSSY